VPLAVQFSVQQSAKVMQLAPVGLQQVPRSGTSVLPPPVQGPAQQSCPETLQAERAPEQAQVPPVHVSLRHSPLLVQVLPTLLPPHWPSA